MSRVILRGNKHIKGPVHYSCKSCESVIEFTAKDIQSDFKDGNYVICPVCGQFIDASQIGLN